MEYFDNERNILEKNPITGLLATNHRIRYGNKENFTSIFLNDISSIEVKTTYDIKYIRSTHSIVITLIVILASAFFIDKELFNQLGQFIYVIPIIFVVGYLLYAFFSKTYLQISSCSSSIQISKKYISSKQLFNFVDILEKYIHIAKH